MKTALIQMNPLVGDLDYNCKKVIELALKAQELGPDLIVFPELALCGYPPKDLLIRDDFLASHLIYLAKIAQEISTPVLLGAPKKRDQELPFNALFLIKDGAYEAVACKRLLPNYNVFDEKRYFSSPQDQACSTIKVAGKKILLTICEDAWNTCPLTGQPRYSYDPVYEGMNKNPDVDFVINVSASPYSMTKPKKREQVFLDISRKYNKPVLVCGQVGANDQLLFDGHSMIIGSDAKISAHARLCSEDILLFDTDDNSDKPLKPAPNPLDLLRDVLVMGIRDYIEKCRAPGVVIALSGGIDSAVVLALTVMALGKDRVFAIYMPSKYSADQSLTDAEEMARNVDVTLLKINIEDCVDDIRQLINKTNANVPIKKSDLCDQNLQARMRGLITMAYANLSDYLMLAPSNKSELAVGYTTIYGDMCGALSPIGDLYKTQVYELAHHLNQGKELIPKNILKKAPSAELKPNQKDSDTLPDYKILDQVLKLFIDDELSVSDIISQTHLEKDLIKQIVNLVSLSEYKRRQAPFPLMVSDKVFGDARRMPIAKRYLYQEHA